MVAYYILSYLTPFCLNDDLVYKFIWPYDNDSFTTPIKTHQRCNRISIYTLSCIEWQKYYSLFHPVI